MDGITITRSCTVRVASCQAFLVDAYDDAFKLHRQWSLYRVIIINRWLRPRRPTRRCLAELYHIRAPTRHDTQTPLICIYSSLPALKCLR